MKMTRKILATVLICALMLTMASFPAMAETTNPYRVKIFTMGDSFTQGVIEPNAYRYYMYEPLIKDGAVFEFIGAQTSQDFRVTDLYKKHGGVGGAVIGCADDYTWNGSSWVTNSWNVTTENGKTIKSGGTKNSIHYRLFAGSDGSNDYTKTEYGKYVAEADIVTLYIGLNDYYSSGATGLSADIEHVKQRYYTVVDRIFEINPDVSLYVTSLNEVPGLRGVSLSEGDTDYEHSVYKYNEFILNDVVAHYTAEGKKIAGISLNQEGYEMGTGDNPSDDSHPNEKGNRKIGTQIYMAIKDEVLALNAQGSDVAYNPTRVTDIAIDTTSVTLKTGENKTIVATVTPSDAEIITTVFSSSNEAVATVDYYGRVTAVGAGTATIYATALDSMRPGVTEIKAACTVTVTADTFEKADADFVDTYVDRFEMPNNWTGNMENVAIASAAYKHPTNAASSSIKSKKTVDLGNNFSLSFGVSVIGVESKEVSDANRNSYKASLSVGKYELRVSVNGKVVAAYYDGTKVAEKVFATPVSRQNDDRYTLAKAGSTVYVYRNNELVATGSVDESSTAEGSVQIVCNGYNTNNVRDLVIKRGFDVADGVILPEKIKVSSVVLETSNSGTIHGALDNIIDGNVQTSWAQSTWSNKTHTFKFDLGKTYNISNMRITWGAATANAYRSTAATVYVSANGTDWETLTNAGDPTFVPPGTWTNDAYVDEIGIATPKEVRYVRVTSTANSADRGLGIREFEVYGFDGTPTKVDYTINCSAGGDTIKTVNATSYVGMISEISAPAISGYTPKVPSQTIAFDESQTTVNFTYVSNDAPHEKLELTGENVVGSYSWGWTLGDQGVAITKSDASVLFDGNDASDSEGYYAHLYANTTTQPENYYIEIDLGAKYDISKFVIQGGSSNWNYAHVLAYDIYGAGEDKVYNTTPIASYDAGKEINSATKIRTDTLELEAYGIQYIKFVPTYALRRFVIGEIEVYGAPAGIGSTEPEKTPATYTVKYQYTNGSQAAPDKVVEDKFVGDTVTEEAVKIAGYIADKNTQSKTLVDGENTIIFTYSAKPAADPVKIIPVAAKSNYDPQDSANFLGSAFDGVATGDWGRYFRPNKEFPQTATKGDASNFYVIADLGSPYNLTELYMKWGTNYATKVAVYGSNDNEAWTEIADLTLSAQESFSEIETAGFYRYVKIEAYGYKVKNCPAILEVAFTGILSSNYEKVSATVVSAPQKKTDATPKENIVDGDVSTKYSSSQYNDSIAPVTNYNVVLELDSVSDVDRLSIVWGGGVATWGHVVPDSYTLYVSEDGTDYTAVTSYTGLLSIAAAGTDSTYTDSDTSILCHAKSETSHRLVLNENDLNLQDVKFIKIEVNSFKYSFSISEIEVYTKIEGGTTEPDEPEVPDEPDTPVEDEREPITLTPTGTSAASSTSARPFAYTTDGDDTTFYANANYHESVSTVNYQYVFDIGYLGTVDSLDILWGDSSWGNTTPNAYKVEVSSNGTSWTQKKSYNGIYNITTGAATDTISGENTVFGITTSKWAIDNNDPSVNAYARGNILEKNLGWTDVRYVRVTVTSVQFRLAIREVTVSSLPNEDQVILSKGGQIRIEDADNDITAGLRFGASIIKMNTGIEGKYVYSDNADIKFGMFMLPKDLLGGKTLTEYLANGVQKALDVPAKKILSQDENFITFTAVLTDIPATAYSREITAVPYVLQDGVYTYFDEMTRSYKGVATSALETTYNPNTITAMADSEEKTALREVSYQLQYIQRGYDKPYTEQGERIVAKLKRGMNMQGLDASTWSSWNSHISVVTSSSTYQNIKNAGFDHVRIPVDFRNAADSNGNLNTSKMTTYVDKAVDAAIGQGLVVLLDFHGWADIMLTDFDYFVTVWTNLATYYKDKYPEDLIFELVNEPHSAEESDGDGGDLNMTNLVTLEVRAIEAIRAVDPDRFICLATAGWNGIWTLRDSGINAASMFRKTALMNYQDTILALHSYTPMEFTHQDMSWAGTGGQTYSWSDKKETYEAAIQEEMGYLVEFVEETGMYVVLNEFGCNTASSVSDADEAAYAKAVVSCIKDNDRIAYTWWEYEQSFGMTSGGSWKTHILNEVMAE